MNTYLIILCSVPDIGFSPEDIEWTKNIIEGETLLKVESISLQEKDAIDDVDPFFFPDDANIHEGPDG